MINITRLENEVIGEIGLSLEAFSVIATLNASSSTRLIYANTCHAREILLQVAGVECPDEELFRLICLEYKGSSVFSDHTIKTTISSSYGSISLPSDIHGLLVDKRRLNKKGDIVLENNQMIRTMLFGLCVNVLNVNDDDYDAFFITEDKVSLENIPLPKPTCVAPSILL